MKLGDISVSYIDILIKAARQLGHDPEPILNNFRLTDVVLSSPDARISIPKFMRLGFALIQQSKSPWIGLIMGSMTSPTNLGMGGLIAIAANDLQQACQQIARYELLSSFNSRGQSKFYLEQGKGIAEFYSVNPYNDYNYFVVDSVLAGWWRMAETITGRKGAVEKVCFEFPEPAYADKYREMFDCEIEFSAQRNCLIIKSQALTWPSIHQCASTFQLLQRKADADLEKVRLGLTFAEKVSRVIGPLLNGLTPTLEQVSEQLNMAPWTVRRKLVDEGTSFQNVLNNTRKDLAVSYVRDTSLSLGEIAYLLGFGSPTAFQRAFKRWTGEAPGGFRQAIRLAAEQNKDDI